MSLIYYSLLVRHVSGTIAGHLQGARKFIDAYSLYGNLMRIRRISAQHCMSITNNNLNKLSINIVYAVYLHGKCILHFSAIFVLKGVVAPLWAQPSSKRFTAAVPLCALHVDLSARDAIHLHSLNIRWPWCRHLWLSDGVHLCHVHNIRRHPTDPLFRAEWDRHCGACVQSGLSWGTGYDSWQGQESVLFSKWCSHLK